MQTDPAKIPQFMDSWRGFITQVFVCLLTVLLMIGGALLSGCQATQTIEPPKPQIVTVEKKVTEPCITKAPVKPMMRWAAGPLPATDKEKVGILLIDWENARQYGIDWESAAVGCVKQQKGEAP